jgi:hypothetical protein
MLAFSQVFFFLTFVLLLMLIFVGCFLACPIEVWISCGGTNSFT